MSEEDFDKVWCQFKIGFNMTKAIQRTFLKQRSGSIIMSSVVGVKGNAGQLCCIKGRCYWFYKISSRIRFS
jgi:3-oxoacyl-[acyl-carrier protein] reductase